MNPRIYILAVVIILLFLVLGEICHQKYFTKPLHFTELPYNLTFLKGRYDNQFGNYLINRDSSCLFTFMDREKKVNFYNVASGHLETSIDFSRYIKGLQFYSARIIGNRLYLLDIDHKWFYLFQLSGCLDTVYHFDSMLDWKKYYLRCQARNVFEVQGKKLFLAYGIYNARSCLDTAAYLEIDLSRPADHLLINKVFPYPKEYYKSYHYKTDTWLRFNDSSDEFIGFANNNTLYKASSSESGYSTISFEKESAFRVFNWDRVNNLAYIRWFVITDESNENAVLLNNNTLLIIKRLKRTEITEECQYEYYILDRNMKTIHHNSFQQGIHPWLCYAWKHGFLVFSEKLDKAFYYETF